MKYKQLKLYFALFFCFSSILFFDTTIISTSILFYVYVLNFMAAVFIIVAGYKGSHHTSFSAPIILILVAEIIAAFNATYSWGQDFVESYKVLLPYMTYILFFLLIVWQFGKDDIEKLIVILGCAYMIIFLFSFYIYPAVLFGSDENDDVTRGFQRIRINGIGFLFLLGFFSLSEYIVKRKILWLLIYLLTLACIFMTLTRTYIFFSIVFSAIFVFKHSRVATKIAMLIVIVVCYYFITQSNVYKILLNETDSQVSYLKDDIRMQAVNFYLYDFSPNLFSQIFGNGQPGNVQGFLSNNNQYAKYVYDLEKGNGLYTADIGYIGLYVKFGILAILSYLILFYKTTLTAVGRDALYCKYYLVFVFTISVIIDAPFNTSFIASIVLAYYMLATSADKETWQYNIAGNSQNHVLPICRN